MPSTQEIKRRIKSVNSTRQITKAMELVSATKMRKSQEVALLSRPYAVEALRILGELSHRTSYRPELMKKRAIKKTMIVLIAADRGLAGSFNTNVFRNFEKRFAEALQNPEKYQFISIGKKAEEYLLRKSIKPLKSFRDFGDYIHTSETKPLSDLLIQGFLKKEWDRVITVGTHFRTTLRQEVMVREVLPVNTESIKETVRMIIPESGRFSKMEEEGGFKKNFKYLIEPSPQKVLDALAPHLIGIELYHIILEGNASEHSARMVAMKNASENASELGDELNLEYNKSRQAAITREISEITAGSEALKN
jgi:F-type H+-transporting ATPase subunit gamma